ncbi:cation transporting ATPase C-terminal domain-containing protein [Cuspidothrix issatschenkoi LEGE 03284]|uniref:cation transporting ATPase C-terminal domain-containing protein n=1 Tax=Cuspidothrix issatschenkoi TaxID=230752 RepID=UPI00187FDC79|nr:cation-translocating P-type ATPase C-terminal domain-containing protein [Cuspidothrix issatschenkoi]MBE9230943.1 cation transporting ATPase C-terminal domain-containing protein [Cuspidothrix issatschenkoi LEGE 03284]
MNSNFHIWTLTPTDVYKTLTTTPQGVSEAEAVIVACQDGNVFACRSERFSILRLGFFTNRLIWAGIGVEWLLILYSPTLQKIFSTAALKPSYLLMLLFC